MKYLVNRETKEHIRQHEAPALLNRHSEWREVPADPEGWIKHDGGECPLPKGILCDIRFSDGYVSERVLNFVTGICGEGFGQYKITHYRPILDDRAEAKDESCSFVGGMFVTKDAVHYNTPEVGAEFPFADKDIITRLKSAHKAANDLPDIIAELRDTLGSELCEMFIKECGYHYVPADKPGSENGGSAIGPGPDMADWRNWRAGDVLTCTYENKSRRWTFGRKHTVYSESGGLFVLDDEGTERLIKDGSTVSSFRFHSRPTKEQS